MLFPVNSLFGGAAYNQPITLTAANTLISDGQNLWAGTYTIIPAATTNPVVNLYPNTYLLTVAGVVKPVRFTVPASTNVLDVTTLLTSGPLFYFGTNGLANLLAGTNILLTTNFDGSITISGTGDPAGAALAATNGLGAGAFMSASTLVTNAAITNSLTPPSIANNTLSIPSELHFGFVATGCRGLGTWTGSSLGIQSRTKHSARANISRIALVFANYYGYNNIGGAASIMASVEYPSNTFTRILFRGQTQGTIPNGAFIVSDTNQLAVSIPEGQDFWVRSFYTNAEGIVFDNFANSLYDSSEYGNAETDKTMTHGSNFVLQPNVYRPLGILGYTDKPSVLLIGDSRCFGVVDTQDSSDMFGYARYIEPTYGACCCAVSGDTFSSYLNSPQAASNTVALAQFATLIFSDMGINSLGNGSNYIIACSAALATNFSIPFYASTLEPKSTSTDGFSTIANQTANANDSDRQGYNAALRNHAIPGVRGCVDVAALIEFGGNSGKWVTTGTANYYTPDGLHGNRNYNRLLPIMVTDIFSARTINPSLIWSGATNNYPAF